jgi:hypothetical protein
MADIPVVSSSVGDGGASASVETPSTFDFGSLHAKAMESFGEQPATPAATPEPAAPVEGTPAETPAPTEQPVEPKPVSLKDDDLVEVVVDGKPVTMSYKDARAGWSRTAKFTQEMQQVRAKEAELETRAKDIESVVEQRDQLVAFLKNKEMVTRYMNEVFGAATQQAAQELVAKGADPDEVATIQEARAIAAEHVKQVESQLHKAVEDMRGEVTRATQELEDKREIAAFIAELDVTVEKVFAENPVLKSIPNSNELLRYEVSKLRPRNIAEAKEAFATVAKGMVEDIRGHFVSDKKQQVIEQEKAKLVTNNLEPPGGAAPAVSPVNYRTKDGKVDWGVLHNAALNYINQPK